MFIPTPVLTCATLLVLALCLTVSTLAYKLQASEMARKVAIEERDLACLDLSEIVAELGRLRAFHDRVSRQLHDLSEDLANAQRAIVRVHGPDTITPERQAIITAASKVDQVRASEGRSPWASST